MNSRQRFLATLSYAPLDRVPFFEEGIRDEVLDEWRKQGMPAGLDLRTFFDLDIRHEVGAELGPRPYPRRWPASPGELEGFRKRLNPEDRSRFPSDWAERVEAWRTRDYPLFLELHPGFFLTLGVEDWKSFYPVICLINDQPELVHGIFQAQAELCARLADRILSEVEVDAVLFSEPIGGNHGSLISPRMYRQFMLPGYRDILAVVRQHAVPWVIMRTYANTRVLLPEWVDLGVNILWAVEAPLGLDMDYRSIRQEFGANLRLIGGIDADALRGDAAAICQALQPVPELLEQGGYIPMLDGRVRVDIGWANYCSYRRRLDEILRG